MIYVLDQEAKNMTIFDSTPPSDRIKDNVPFKRYVKSILRLEQDYRLDMDVQGFG
jgi:hypothetical protein